MGPHDQHSDGDIKSTSSDSHSIHSIPVPDQPKVESISTPLPTTDGIHPIPSPDDEDASSLEKQVTASIASEDIDPIFVPKGQRRGLLARVAVIAEVEDPRHYARRTNWFITFVVAVAGDAVKITSRILLNEFYFAPEEYEQLKAFYELIVQKHAEQIVLKKK